MRKFTLILASLFLSLGTVWAQTPVVTVTEIGTAPYKLSDEDAAKIFGLENLTVVLDVTTAASLSGRGAFFCVADPAEAVPGSFSGSNTSYMACGHNDAGAAYLAAAKSGQHFSTGTIPANSTIRLAYVFDKTNNKFKIYIGDTNTTWTMDRNFGTYEIATPKMVKEDFENAKIYIGGGMVNNNAYELGDATIHAVRVFDGALSVNEIKAVDYVKTADDFVNGKIYTFETQRGWMGAMDDVDNVISSAYASNGVTGSKDEANFQWTVYKSVNGYNYLYNVGKKKFMGVQSSNNTAISFVDAPAGKNLTFKTSGNVLYPLMFSTDGNAVVNHSTDRAPGLISWTGGWNNLNDEGSNHRVVAVGELDANTFATIKAAVEAFEVDNTQEVAALDAAIVKAENFFSGIKLGSGVGQYTATDADYLNKFAGIKTFRAGIVDINTPTPADIKEKIDELETIIASVQLNLPMAGKYYRILAVAGYNDDARYLGAQNKSGTDRAEFVADADVNTIFYFDGTYLLSYASNMYLANNNGFIGYNGSNKIDVEFQAAAKGLIGAYNLTYNSQGRYMYCHANDNRTDGGGSTNDNNGYCFNLEEVKESERIALSEAKIGDTYYATFENAMAAEGDGDVELLVEKAITLDDDNAYTYTKGAYDVDVEYSRDLIPGIWNPIYLPFEAGLNLDDYDVAEFTSAEGNTVVLTKLTADNEGGDVCLEANKAYVVRAKRDEVLTLDLGVGGAISSNEEVEQALGNGFSVRGNYAVRTGAVLEATDRVVGSNGNWGVLKSASTLKPYRLILSVPENFNASQEAISMRVLDETTGVEEIIVDRDQQAVIFDLMGRRVETITEGGIYIVNGKKVVR